MERDSEVSFKQEVVEINTVTYVRVISTLNGMVIYE